MESNHTELEKNTNAPDEVVSIINDVDNEEFLRWCEYKKQTGSKPVDDYKAYPDTSITHELKIQGL